MHPCACRCNADLSHRPGFAIWGHCVGRLGWDPSSPRVALSMPIVVIVPLGCGDLRFTRPGLHSSLPPRSRFVLVCSAAKAMRGRMCLALCSRLLASFGPARRDSLCMGSGGVGGTRGGGKRVAPEVCGHRPCAEARMAHPNSLLLLCTCARLPTTSAGGMIGVRVRAMWCASDAPAPNGR